MMRFPALLAARIAKARIAQIFRPRQSGRLLEYVNPADVLHPGSEHPVSREKIHEIIASPAPVVWIVGGEPLEHPGIAHLVRALAPSGHYLFLETNGVRLRRRIHEFQPLPRVFLTVRANPQRKPEFDLAVEGLRAAHLSGFYTAVHSLIGEDWDLADLERLRELVLELDVDAWMVTAESPDAGARQKAAQARTLVPSVGWRRFSTWLERHLLIRLSGAREVPQQRETQGQSCEESVKVA